MEEIGFYSRDVQFGWMSNFHRCNQIVDGKVYPTNEHYYQSQKATGADFQEWIRNSPNPYHAMLTGRALRAGKPGELRDNWDSMKLAVMRKGLQAKFDPKQNPSLVQLLLLTKDAYIYENSPSDRYWGKVKHEGTNYLGELLMQIRTDLRRNVCKHLLED